MAGLELSGGGGGAGDRGGGVEICHGVVLLGVMKRGGMKRESLVYFRICLVPASIGRELGNHESISRLAGPEGGDDEKAAPSACYRKMLCRSAR
jgi:hypothetical protein